MHSILNIINNLILKHIDPLPHEKNTKKHAPPPQKQGSNPYPACLPFFQSAPEM
jgi:hypothetical protein